MARVSNKEKQYRDSLEQLFSSPLGLIVLKNWQERYIDTPAHVPGSDYPDTMYKLGKKELVQEVINQIHNREELDLMKLSSINFDI